MSTQTTPKTVSKIKKIVKDSAKYSTQNSNQSSNKSSNKKLTKRIIVDYTQNLDLEYILSQLENVYFAGLSKAEITKLAIIQLFKIESKGFVPNLTDEEEASLAKAMEDDGGFVTIPQGQSFSQFLLQTTF